MKRYRKMTWALIVWSVLMLIWIVAGASSTHCASKATKLEKNACEAGTGIGVGALIVLWFMGFVVLGIIWFMTRPREQRGTAPAPAAMPPPPPPPSSQPVQAGWYPDPFGGAGQRWWDGRRWTGDTA